MTFSDLQKNSLESKNTRRVDACCIQKYRLLIGRCIAKPA